MSQPDDRLKVLVVDDEEIVRDLLRRRLDGCEVFEAATFDQAGDILRRKTVDVVVADNITNGRSDRDPLRLCARLQPQARRIMFSGAPPADLQRLLDKEIVHSFVAKPVDDALIAQIEAIIAARSGADPARRTRREAPGVHAATKMHDAPTVHAAPTAHDPPTVHAAPTVQEAPKVSPRSLENQEVLEQLRGELAALQKKTDIVALGLRGLTDPSTAARTAFYTLSKRYHPDTYGKYGDPEIKQVATEIFILIKGAYTRVLKVGRDRQARGR